MRFYAFRFALTLSVAIVLVQGCGQKEERPSLSLNLDVQGDEESLKRNKEDPRSGFCDYYFSKEIETAREKNALGFCYVRAGDIKKGEIYIWQAAREGDPLAIKNKEMMMAEYRRIGIDQSFNYADTGRTVEEIIGGNIPKSDAVIDGAFAWVVGMRGSFPTGSLVLKNTNSQEKLYTVRVWYIDQKKVSRSYKIEMVGVPSNMAVNITLRGDRTFTYPSEGWAYKLEINETMNDNVVYRASGPLPIDYDGMILGM